MRNPVVHFEIYGSDPGTLAEFYTSLFDWKIEPFPGMDYRVVKTVETDDHGTPRGHGINGGMVAHEEARRPGWINYVAVDSVDRSIERAKELGAKVHKGREAVPGMGWFAILEDPQGNPFALWQTGAKAK